MTGIFITSCGGGALLAALALDLVAPGFERGHYAWLASGCMASGLLFVVLNGIVNDYGGSVIGLATLMDF